MSVEETLLIVMTVAVVLLILMVTVVLIVALQLLRKVKQATDEVRKVTAKSAGAAEKLAPLGMAVVSVIQFARVLNKVRR